MDLHYSSDFYNSISNHHQKNRSLFDISNCRTDCGLLSDINFPCDIGTSEDNRKEINFMEEQLMVDLIDTIVYAGRLKINLP